MTESFDATARLADGAPGVADLEQYVLACQCLGYRHPDLTAHPGQVRYWYAAEDGLDLGALGTDCAALQSAVTAAEDALARHEAQLEALSTAWQGAGASASREFLRRHGQAATVAATAVQTAASALADLRERLWTTVDDKVAKVTAIGDGVQARRADWLAAAQTVTMGAGDRAVASELVDHEVKPFVDTVISGDWLAAMRAATDAIEAAYEAVTAQLAPEIGAVFDVPGQLGPAATGISATPAATGVSAPPAAAGVAPAPVTPAGWAAPVVSPALPALSATPPPLAGTPPPAVTPPPPPESAAPALPSLGGGVPDLGGAFSGFGQQLAELLGGLLGEGALDGGLDDPTEPDIGTLNEGSDDEKLAEEDEENEDEENEEAGAQPEDSVEPTVEEPVCTAAPAEVAEAPVEEPPAATVPPEPPVPPEPLAVPAEPPTAGTPCEIAADELPQVGE
ncbi:hypothetical protein [Mycobacterium sp. 1164985.4]|uniref:hypothetical protein n=1 Tax=Mycobacterium sp. 1164985.4 TaxID=1834069 RepID=UPI0007FFBE99|nr:hypothetical protein [Mycobacterium sp. 1164985.4]OBK73194.1 hypothetical protein A5650_22190 [Mycobacterium sp. 1164985.4]